MNVPTAPVAFVTGASEGLGAALARELATRGWRLALTARRPAPLQALAATLAPASVLALAGDVADVEHVERLIAATYERFGRVDALVNNASTLGPVPLREISATTAAQFARVLEVNVVAPQRLIAAVTARSPDAVIVNVTSDAASNAYPCWGAYGAAKAALEHLSRILAEERPQQRILLVDPGEMNTTMHRDALPDADPNSLLDPRRCARALADALASASPGFRKIELAKRLTEVPA